MQTNKRMNEPPHLEMKIDIRVLEHLGLKMYTSLPAVIAEYVANCWDAGATLVDITIPEEPIDEEYAITIDDNGQGMTVEEVNRKFLVVGRRRREEEGTDVVLVNGKPRKVIGRKGIGKLAGFGVAGRVEVRTRKNGEFVEFRMDYDKMQKRLSEEDKGKIKTTYLPEVLDWGVTEEPNGTTVRLSRLKRKRPVDISYVRRNLARHFSVLGEDFIVRVNGEPLTPAERELKRECEFVWEVNEVIDQELGLRVYGWIGTMKKTVPPEIERGIVIMARGKLVQTPTTFDVGGRGITGQHALAYLVGEIHADFLDEEEDLIATGRRSVIWEKEPAATLRRWVNEKIREICRCWAEKRRERKMKAIRELPIYKERIETLPRREKKIIDGFLAKMAEREDIEEEAIIKLADFLASSVEYDTFLDLMRAIDEAGVTKPEILIEFFKEWEILDAIEMIRIVEGRLKAINKFQELVRIKAKEVPTLHKFLVDNPWILDPTWDYLDDEVDYRNMLLEKFPEAEDVPEENRRIDFLCLGYGNVLNVIELKRPGSTIGRKELRQLEDYVDFISPLLGTDPQRSYQTVVGYIIGGRISRDVGRRMIERLRRDGIYVRTYEDLRRVIRNRNQVFKSIRNFSVIFVAYYLHGFYKPGDSLF
ncbi:hypothetical protein B6U84_05560 [Candidatus Bathyarchaeota archaeon ex4484_40]|nr:MAG: hypothetical protein B6U84_05560 [Candidatus Bathyarchaeota archaeon ex4484_40]